MSVGSFASRPPSSSEFRAADLKRYDSIERKQQRIAQFLRDNQYDALLLQHPATFAWFTSGAIGNPIGPDQPATSLFITADARVVVTNNVDSAELFDRELSGLGFLLKERPWHEPREVLVDDICRGRRIASDTGFQESPNVWGALTEMRLRLDDFETEKIRELGALVTHAVEATLRNIAPGETEAEIAGQVAHRLVKHEVLPVDLRVTADGRGRLYRHHRFSDVPLQRWCSISATGSRWGLHCSATRLVCFGNPPDDLAGSFQQAAMLAGTALHFSQAGQPFVTVWEKVRRIYEKIGLPEEWQACDQASVTGYQSSEIALLPKSDRLLAPGMALHWHPAAGPVQLGDTILLKADRKFELLTVPKEWPLVNVAVRDATIPDLLCREPG